MLSLFSNTVILYGTITEDLSALASWASFTYTGLGGVYTNCEDNQVLLMSATNDIKTATFRGRLRGTPDATHIYCNESAVDFLIGNYFWVINTYDIQYIQSRPSTNDPQTAVELVNYNETYQNLKPRVLGLQTAYAGFVDPDTNYLRLAFDVSRSAAAAYGATISSYAFTFPSGTPIAGSVSSSIVVVDIPYGEQWATCAVTDSNGQVTRRKFGIKAHDPALYPPDTGFENNPVSASLDQGYTLTIPAFADVDDVLYNTFAVAWRYGEQIDGIPNTLYKPSSSDVTYKELTSNVATITTSAPHSFEVGQRIVLADVGSGFDGTREITAVTSTTVSFVSVHANVAGAAVTALAVSNPVNVDFVGWFMREDDPLRSDPTHSVSSSAKFVFTGVGPRLARLTAQFVVPRENASPSLWGDIYKATPWRAFWHFWSRYTTVANLVDIEVNPADETYQFPEYSTKGGNSLRSVQEIAAQTDSTVDFAPTGQIYVYRDVNYLAAFERADTPVIATWTSADAIEITRTIDPNPNVGKADAETAYYDPVTQQVTFFATRAPGVAQGEAEGTDTLPAQILTAGNDPSAAVYEARVRIGSRYNIANLKEYLDVVHPDDYMALPIVPSRSVVYKWVLQDTAGPNGVNRIDYDENVLWTVESVTYEYAPKRGTFVNRVRYRRVAEPGQPGDNITQQIPTQNAPSPQPFPGFPAFNFQSPLVPDAGITNPTPAQQMPPPNQVAKAEGNTAIVWGGSRLDMVTNLILMPTPTERNITPPGVGTRTVTCAAFDWLNSGVASGNNKLYALDTNNTNSRGYFTPTCFAPVPLYLQGNDFTGVYTLLRPTMTSGNVMVYAPSTDVSNIVVDAPADIAPPGRNTGVSITAGDIVTIKAEGTWTIDGSTTFGPNGTGTGADPTFVDPSSYYWSLIGQIGTGGTYFQIGPSLTFTAGSSGNLYVLMNDQPAAYGDNTGALRVTISIATASSDAAVRVSSDNAINFGTPATVGATPGSVGGFDVQRSGSVSYAACANKVRKATSVSSPSYADFVATTGANAVCVVIPYYEWGYRDLAHKNTTTSTPVMAMALDQADSDGGTLYRVSGAGTKTDITPVAGMTFDNSGCITTLYGTHMAVFGKVSGVYKLYVSTDIGSGDTWTLAESPTTPEMIRVRRNDTSARSGGNKGQLFLLNNGPKMDYSSTWASTGTSPHTIAFSATGIDILN